MLADSSKYRTESHRKSLQKSKQIDTLYRQFQSLKSQIYGQKNLSKFNKNTKWINSSRNQIETKQFLRESSIKKYERQFAEKMRIMQRSQLIQVEKNDKRHYKRQDIQKRESSIEQLSLQNKNFSKKLESFHQKQYPQISEIQCHQQNDDSLQVQEIRFSHGEQIFKQFLNSPNRSSMIKKKFAGPFTSPDIDFTSLQTLFQDIACIHCQKLTDIIQNVSFLTRKLHCLQTIVQQYGKVTKVRRDQNIIRRNNEHTIILDIKRIQKTYQQQIKGLVLFYEDKLKQAQKKYVQSLKEKIRDSQLKIPHRFEEETNKMKNLLEQAKQLISTKQQLILSLNQENNELRDQIDHLKKYVIKKSKQSSLLYSATGDKYAEALQNKIQINPYSKLSKKLDEIYINSNDKEGENWQQFQNQDDDQINYSQLKSLKDKSMDQWDISQLDLKLPSNTKYAAKVSLDLLGEQS